MTTLRAGGPLRSVTVDDRRARADLYGVRENGPSRARLEAAVFDLDGVITGTARLHFLSWKQLFDPILEQRAGQTNADSRPFEEADYRTWVDGRPRSEGLTAFLAARGITHPNLPELLERKNRLFNQAMEEHGVEVHSGAVALLRELKAAGIPVGVATSSKNAARVLQVAGLDQMFDARVDGVTSERLRLRGKPAPDAFLHCLALLGGADAARSAMFEDATFGVAAGRAGGFGMVVGVDRGANWLRLREAGADVIVRHLAEIAVPFLNEWIAGRHLARPNALYAWKELRQRIERRPLAIFLDYDGTLTPIVSRPELAVLSRDARSVLESVSARWPTHIISGRGLKDVREKVGLPSLWYAGSHGFEISLPPGTGPPVEVRPELVPAVEAASMALEERIAAVPGVIVEKKRFAVAVHYRLVDPDAVPALEREVDAVVSRVSGLKKTLGKMVFEVRPGVDWDKGRAVVSLIDRLGLGTHCSIFVGDDVTDEDAFAVVRESGLGVLVTDRPKPTAASYSLQNTEEVVELLRRLAVVEEKGGGRGA